MFKIKFFAFIIFISFFLLFLSSNSYAWDDCPFGYEDDPYPGLCWRYIDTDNDGICDHSQSEKSAVEIDYEKTGKSYFAAERTDGFYSRRVGKSVIRF